MASMCQQRVQNSCRLISRASLNLAWAFFPTLLLLKLAHSDLRHRRLANTLVISYALLFVLYAWWAGFDPGRWGAHALTAAFAFLVLLVLFALGAMGGGDVKLGTAVLLWAGPTYALPVVLLIAWVGGGLAVLGLLADRPWAARFAAGPSRHIITALSARRGVPYGVALAVAGLWLVWQQFFGVV